MDPIVHQAMAKWPDVPACYGWLALDARGTWRMRDARAQQLGLAGDKIVQTALLGFIARNYGDDERGCWFFQNGPQRVYVQLESTPYVARTDGAQGFVLHTGQTFSQPDAAWLTETGALILQHEGRVAQLDDRDFAQVMARLAIDGAPADDDALLAWLDGGAGRLSLSHLPVEHLRSDAVAEKFGFERQPTPTPSSCFL